MKNKTKKKNAKKPSKPTQSQDGILNYLKKIFTWQTIVGVITVITFFFLIYDHFYRDELKELKDDIKKQITLLEDELTLDPLPASIDTLPDVLLIKEFQKHALDACTYWKMRESESPYLDFVPENSNSLNVLPTAEFDQDELFKNMGRSIGIMGNIYKYASESGITLYKSFDLNKHLNLIMLLQDKIKIRKNYIERSNKYLPQNKEKAKKTLDELKSDPNYYTFDKSYFETVREANNIYKMAIRNYLYKEQQK